MSQEFEKDELLAKLAKTAGKQNAPKLSEDLLHSATRTVEKFGPRKWHTPKLILNLVGGAAVLAAVFAISMNSSLDSGIRPLEDPNVKLDARIDSGSALLAMGNKTFSEQELVDPLSISLAEWGQRSVGNYVSNNPDAFLNEIWSGNSSPTWIFVVADGIYIPNDSIVEIRALLAPTNLDQVRQELTADSDQPGIKLLLQDDTGTLFPLVIKENPDSTLYVQLRDILLSQSFTLVPTE